MRAKNRDAILHAEITEEILRISESGTKIIVEGKKDKESLMKLGLSNIIVLNKPLYAVTESIDDETVVILTDLDPEGRKLYHKLKSWLSSRGVKVDDTLRRLLFKAKVRNIEALYGMMQKWKSQKE